MAWSGPPWPTGTGCRRGNPRSGKISLLWTVLLLLIARTSLSQTAQDPLALRLTEVASRFAPSTQPLGPIEFGMLVEGESRFVEIPLGGSPCWTIVAVSQEPESDLDLHLYAQRVEVASHTGSDNFPVVHWCNAAADRVSLEIRMYAGSGRYAFQVFSQSSGPEGQDPDLRAALDALAAQVAEGLLPAAETVHGILGTGQENEFDLRLAQGRCYVILGAGSATVVDLDLVLLDSHHTPIDADEATDARPVLRICTTETQGGIYSVRSRMAAGYGEYGILVLGD